MKPRSSHVRLPIEICARDFGDPIYARAADGGRFRDVAWGELPAYYDTPDETWILIERNGSPFGIVDCGLSDGPDERLAPRMRQIGSHQIVAGDASLIEVLQRFTAGPPWFLLVLTGAQATHWIEPLHLSSWPVKLAFLAKCLEVDEALEKVVQLNPKKYLEGFADVDWRRRTRETARQMYSRSAEPSDRELVRCASFTDRWKMLKKHPDVLQKAVGFMDSQAAASSKNVDTVMRKTIDLRNALVHGHMILPFPPRQFSAGMLPDERHWRDAGELYSTLLLIDQIVSSLNQYART